MCGVFSGSSSKWGLPDPTRLKSAGVCRLREGAAAVRGSCASPDSAIHGSNRRAQAIHGLLAHDPRTTASFAIWMPVASSMPAPACPAEAGNATSRRTSLQGDFVRAVHGCTAPACWSRTRNHAADEIPLQRRPLPEVEAPALDLRRRPQAPSIGEEPSCLCHVQAPSLAATSGPAVCPMRARSVKLPIPPAAHPRCTTTPA